MSNDNKVVVDMEKCLRPIKQKAYSTMCNMRKQDLIDYIRELENNYNVAIAFNEQQAQNFEMLLKEREEKLLQLPKEDADGILIGGTYRHFKGKEYVAMAIAEYMETGEPINCEQSASCRNEQCVPIHQVCFAGVYERGAGEGEFGKGNEIQETEEGEREWLN